MRVADLLSELAPAPTRVLDRTPGAFPLGDLFGRLDIVGERVAAVAGDLVVVATGRSGPAYEDLDVALAMLLDGLAVGAHACLLFADGADAIPVPPLLAWCEASAARVVGAAALEYRWFRSGVVATIEGAPTTRLGNELALTRVVQRAMQRRLDTLEARLAGAQRAAGGADAQQAGPGRALGAMVDELTATVAQRDARLRELAGVAEQYRIAAATIEDSTSFQLGVALTRAARPGRDTIALPKRLARLWSNRGAWRERTYATTAPTEAGPVEAGRPHPDAHLLHAFRRLPSFDEGPMIAGVISRHTVAAIDDQLQIVALWPNDADAVLERIQPLAVIVDSAAAAAGETWSGLGHAVGAHLEYIVDGVLATAQRRGLPTVFWWTTAPSDAPGLRRLAARCDVVAVDPAWLHAVEGVPLSTGVPWSRLQPRPPTQSPGGRPLLHARSVHLGNDPVERAVRDAGVARGMQICFDPDPRVAHADLLRPTDVGARYASAPWAMATPFEHLPADAVAAGTLLMAASGAAIIGGPGALPSCLRGHVVEVVRSVDADAAIDLANAWSFTDERCRAVLAVCWQQATIERQLERILHGLGADAAALEECTTYAVDASAVEVEDLDRLAADVLRQSDRPASVIAPAKDAAELGRLAGELAAADIDLVVDGDPRPGRVAVEWTGARPWEPDHLAVACASARLSGPRWWLGEGCEP